MPPFLLAVPRILCSRRINYPHTLVSTRKLYHFCHHMHVKDLLLIYTVRFTVRLEDPVAASKCQLD